MKVFVPATEESLYGPATPHSELVPYQVGVPCFHWQIVPVDDRPAPEAGNDSASAGEARQRTGTHGS
jgi:hypothetical protein